MMMTTRRPRQSLTKRTRRTAAYGQVMAIVVGVLGVVSGIAMAADDQPAGIGIAIGSAAWAFMAYAVLLYIEWQMARAMLEQRHAIAKTTVGVSPAPRPMVSPNG